MGRFGGRTNRSGLDQLAAALEPLGARVVASRSRKVLHLKSAVTALPDGTVVGYPPLVDDPAVWEKFLRPGGAGLARGAARRADRADVHERTTHAGLFEARGLRVVAVDLTEYEKLEGCVTCLSVRLR